MVNKEIQKDIKRELLENFRVFYASLYQHKSIKEVEEGQEKYLKDIKELADLGDDADLKVKFVCDTLDRKVKHTQYKNIQEFVKNGVDMDEKVFRFYVVIKAEFRKGDVKYQSADTTPFFKSENFVIKEADKRFAKLCEEAIKQGRSKSVVVSREDLQQFSNERIRFGETNIMEV